MWFQYGHGGRVWDCDYIISHSDLHSDLIASVAEDATCKVWDMENGNNICNFRGHQGKNVWRVCHKID